MVTESITGTLYRLRYAVGCPNAWAFKKHHYGIRDNDAEFQWFDSKEEATKYVGTSPFLEIFEISFKV
jgi:hypothetical protein